VIKSFLRRLFGQKKRYYEIDMTRLRRDMLRSVCYDGDFAAVVGRPDVTVKEMEK